MFVLKVIADEGKVEEMIRVVKVMLKGFVVSGLEREIFGVEVVRVIPRRVLPVAKGFLVDGSVNLEQPRLLDG